MDERASAIWLLRTRLLALCCELRHWKAVSRPPAPPRFLTNHSQIRAFALIIRRFISAISHETRNPEFTAADAQASAKDLLALFRIWEFFRAKVAQRLDERYAANLQLADEFAWACYHPAAAKIYKEPPLVFLNGGLSPFILPRDREFSAEFVPNELIQNDDLIEAMSRLPFPVIGVPWYQLATPWELPVIAHEVGHSIEGDLQLEKPLRDSIGAAVSDESRRSRWKSWSSEIFADFYGTVAIGPAFVSNLAEFLAGANHSGDDRYPPTSIRLQVNLAFLGNEFQDAVTSFQSRWTRLLIVPPEYEHYPLDVDAIAAGLRTLDVGLTRFDRRDYQAAFELARTALASGPIDGLPDVRVIVAALRVAYDTIMERVPHPQATAKEIPRLSWLIEVLKQSARPGIRARDGESDGAQRKAAHLARSQTWLS